MRRLWKEDTLILENTMFCRYCGKTLNNVMACPNCGKDNGVLEGGNGFWDILTDPIEEHSKSSHSEVVYVERRDPADEAALNKEKEKNQLLTKTLIGAILICFALIGTTVFLGNRLKNTSQSAKEHESKLESLQVENAQLSEELSLSRERVNELEETMNATNVPLQISSDCPTDVSLPLESSGNKVFSALAQGECLVFQWQKWDDEVEEWVDILFVKSRSAELGILLETFATEGQSWLIADGINEESEGKYRCHIRDLSTDKDDYTRAATLTVSGLETLLPNPTPDSEAD